MKLTFYDSTDNERYIGNFETEELANKAIHEFLDEHGYKSKYWRITRFSDKKVYDVGSWSEFFILYDDDNEILNIRKVWEE